MSKYLFLLGILASCQSAISAENQDLTAFAQSILFSESVLCSAAYDLHGNSILKATPDANIDGWKLLSNGAMYAAAMAHPNSTKGISLDDLRMIRHLRDYYSEILVKDRFMFIHSYMFVKCDSEKYNKLGVAFKDKSKAIFN